MNQEIIEDIEKKLNINFNQSNIHYFQDGATNSIVLAIDNKFLIKIVDERTK